MYRKITEIKVYKDDFKSLFSIEKSNIQLLFFDLNIYFSKIKVCGQVILPHPVRKVHFTFPKASKNQQTFSLKRS